MSVLQGDRTFKQPLNWTTTSFMLLFHVGAVVALFLFSWKALALAVVLYWVAGSLGIGMGYHRLLTHRGYKTPTWVEYFLTTCGTLALEGGPIAWVAILTFGEGWHNNHHAAPQAAKHGLAWYEVDVNWYGIAVLRMLGLAWDVKLSKLSPVPSDAEEQPHTTLLIPPTIVDAEAMAPTSVAGD